MISREPPRVGFDALFALSCALSGFVLGAPLGFAACLFFFPS